MSPRSKRMVAFAILLSVAAAGSLVFVAAKNAHHRNRVHKDAAAKLRLEMLGQDPKMSEDEVRVRFSDLGWTRGLKTPPFPRDKLDRYQSALELIANGQTKRPYILEVSGGIPAPREFGAESWDGQALPLFLSIRWIGWTGWDLTLDSLKVGLLDESGNALLEIDHPLFRTWPDAKVKTTREALETEATQGIDLEDFYYFPLYDEVIHHTVVEVFMVGDHAFAAMEGEWHRYDNGGSYGPVGDLMFVVPAHRQISCMEISISTARSLASNAVRLDIASLTDFAAASHGDYEALQHFALGLSDASGRDWEAALLEHCRIPGLKFWQEQKLSADTEDTDLRFQKYFEERQSRFRWDDTISTWTERPR